MKDKLYKLLDYKYLIFLLCFLIGKVSVFFGPIILSNTINDINIYGNFEYILGTAMIFINFTNIGFSGAIPYFLIKKKEVTFSSFFYKHLFYLSVISVFFYSINLFFDNDYLIAIFIAITLTMYLQLGTRFKTDGNSSIGVLADSLFYIGLVLFSILLFFTDFSFDFSYLISFTLLINFFILFYSFKKIDNLNLRINEYKKVLNFSLKLIIFSVSIVFIYTSQRFLIGSFLSNEDVGIYSVIFRMSATVIIFHQLISTAFFKNIYKAGYKKLDFLFSTTLILVLFTSLLIWNYSAFFSELIFNSNISNIIINNKEIHLIIIIQILLWVISAQNENIINRENLSLKAFNRSFLIVIFISLFYSLFFWNNDLNLTSVLIFITLVMSLVNFSNYQLLYSHKIKLNNTIIVNILSITIVLIIIKINQ